MSLWSGELEQEEAISVLMEHGYITDPKQAFDVLTAAFKSSAYAALTSNGRERYDRLVPLLLAAAGLGKYPEKH